MLLIVVLCYVQGSLLLLVLVIDIRTAMFDQKLCGLELPGPHRVVQRGLAVFVSVVWKSAKIFD